MGRGDKLLSDSGWHWAGSLQRQVVLRRFHPSALFSPFHSLNPFTSYKLRVKATNDIGDSDFSVETEAVTTLQDGKGGRGEAHWGHHRGVGAPQGSWTHCRVFSMGTAVKTNSQSSFVHGKLTQVAMRYG